MDNEVLERLLIDRASGELSPDVEELLESHLEQDPVARNEAAEIGETLRLARLALAGQPAIVLPVPRPSWRVPIWACGMAACFVCGLLLGLFTIHTSNEPPRITASNPEQKLSAITTADEPGLWSARRFRASLSTSRTKPETRFIWKSPVRKPVIF